MSVNPDILAWCNRHNSRQCHSSSPLCAPIPPARRLLCDNTPQRLPPPTLHPRQPVLEPRIRFSSLFLFSLPSHPEGSGIARLRYQERARPPARICQHERQLVERREVQIQSDSRTRRGRGVGLLRKNSVRRRGGPGLKALLALHSPTAQQLVPSRR